MAWDDAPPTPQEMKSTLPSPGGGQGTWDSAPPTPEELKQTQTSPLGDLAGVAPAMVLPKIAMMGMHKASDLYDKYIDPYTGAPVRAGLEKFYQAPEGQAISEGLLGYKNQFGQPSEQAPSAEKLAEDVGVPEGLPRTLASLPISLATDPVNWMGLAGEKAGLLAEKAMPLVESAVAKVGSKIGHALTGVDKAATEAYIKRTPEINKMISKYGGDISQAADAIREQFSSIIQGKRKELNKVISSSLAASPKEKSVNIGPILEQLEKHKARINPDLKPEAIEEIDQIIGRVKKVANGSGESNQGSHLVNSQELFDIKDFLQDRAKGAYQSNGQFYVPGKETQQAAKAGGALARKSLNETLPELADANNQHSVLHDIENNINKALLQEGKPEAALVRAGSVPGRERRSLGRLENITGRPMIEQAENLGAMKQFANPPLTNPIASRSAIAGAAGYLAGHVPGAVIAGGMTSPAALKAGVNVGNAGRNLIDGLLANRAAIGQVYNTAQKVRATSKLGAYLEKRRSK